MNNNRIRMFLNKNCFILITIIFLQLCTISCKSSSFIQDSAEIKKIVIYCSPFHIRYNIGISYADIKKRASHYIIIKDVEMYYPKYLYLKSDLESLKLNEVINQEDLNYYGVRAKITFHFKNTRKKVTLYVTESKNIIIGNKLYEKSDKILHMFELL